MQHTKGFDWCYRSGVICACYHEVLIWYWSNTAPVKCITPPQPSEKRPWYWDCSPSPAVCTQVVLSSQYRSQPCMHLSHHNRILKFTFQSYGSEMKYRHEEETKLKHIHKSTAMSCYRVNTFKIKTKNLESLKKNLIS